MTLFDQFGAGLCATYVRIRDDDSASGMEHRALLDAQWRASASFLDQNFKSAFAHQTAQRYWELRLINALLARGFELDPAAEHRPDIATRLPDGRRLWIEATAPTLGASTNPDSPPLPPPGRTSAVPTNRLLLRLSQGVWDKTQKLRHYREQGIIADGDCTAIALSAGAFWPFGEAPDHPRILSVLFPIGDEHWVIDAATNEVIRIEHAYRGAVIKANGSTVAMTSFDTPAFCDVSGLIYDFARPHGIRQQDFGRFYTIENPFAAAPLPRDYLPLGHAYRIEQAGDERDLICTDHQRPASLIAPQPMAVS